MSKGKREFNAIDNGQELTIDLVKKWLEEDLAKMAGLLHVLRTEPAVKDAMVKLMYEKSITAQSKIDAVNAELKSK